MKKTKWKLGVKAWNFGTLKKLPNLPQYHFFRSFEQKSEKWEPKFHSQPLITRPLYSCHKKINSCHEKLIQVRRTYFLWLSMLYQLVVLRGSYQKCCLNLYILWESGSRVPCEHSTLTYTYNRYKSNVLVRLGWRWPQILGLPQIWRQPQIGRQLLI